VKGNVGRQYSNQTTLNLVYDRLMHEFNQLEDKGHHSVLRMIEKCASLAAEFYAEIEEEDQMEDEMNNDNPDIQSDQEDPPDPPAAPSIDPGHRWNAPELTTETTKMRLPGIKISSFWCFIVSLQCLCLFSAIYQTLAITT
jgi:hypothetical protein